jgi:hypothetical protein
MSNRLSCNQVRRQPATSRRAALFVFAAAVVCLACSPRVFAGDAPGWMHAAANAPLPAHDEKTDAVLIHSETSITVESVDKVKTHVRIAYRILRPSGREYGLAFVSFNSHSKITSLHGWCIPAQGKDYEVKDKDAVEVSLPKIEGSELIQDVRLKVLNIPAPDPGNIVGYEYEKEERPFALQDSWDFQREIPARELHYSLQLPAGWEFKASWLHHPEEKPTPNRCESVAMGGCRSESDP